MSLLAVPRILIKKTEKKLLLQADVKSVSVC